MRLEAGSGAANPSSSTAPEYLTKIPLTTTQKKAKSMVGTSSSSSSSCASFGSFDDVCVKPAAATVGSIKFLCSYGGKILPRHPDGKLRYVGGDTRVLSVDRSLCFSDLQGKLREVCGWEVVNLRCQLPTEDLDALISVTSDEDLANLVEEYNLANRDRLLPLKIRAFLLPPGGSKTPRSLSPPSTPPVSKPKSPFHRHHHKIHASRAMQPSSLRCVHQVSASARLAGRADRPGDSRGRQHQYQQHQHHYYYQHGGGDARPDQYLIHNGNHWQ